MSAGHAAIEVRTAHQREEIIRAAEPHVGRAWAEWYALTPLERWQASQSYWSDYLALGGSLEPEVDMQSPFWSADELAEFARRHDQSRRRDQRAPDSASPRSKPAR